MTLLPPMAPGAQNTFWPIDAGPRPFAGEIWRQTMPSFDAGQYAASVEALPQAFEEQSGRRLEPGLHRRAALKVYTGSGAGMHTPAGLVEAVIAALKRRGFADEELCLIDSREETLRAAGFLPPLSQMSVQGPYFRHIRVYALSRGELKSPAWYYDSPLPREFSTPLGREVLQPILNQDPEEARKSYLPDLLCTGVDFWINLPMAGHLPSTGLSGALANASIWNVTNGSRFFSSPVNAPVAVAEIAAIPELKASLALNIVSLEEFQFIAGPGYNANYTASRPELWLAVDPVILDANLVSLLNAERESAGFRALPEVPEFISFSMQLGLGDGIASSTRWHELASAEGR